MDEGGQGVGEEDTLVKEGTREEKKMVGVEEGDMAKKRTVRLSKKNGSNVGGLGEEVDCVDPC
jgi:hypothetical protein